MTYAASDPRPKPMQVADTMRERIERGAYPSGKLPTSRELAKEFGFAGQTVRDGLSILVSEGLIFSAGNRGYFIADETEEQNTPKQDVGEEINELRSQIHALTERVAALEKQRDQGGA